MTPTRARILAGAVSAVITFLLVTQTDVALAPIAKVALGAVNVALVYIDWGALITGQSDKPAA